METLEERVARVVAEPIEVVPYNPEWPRMFQEEKVHLESVLPRELITRIDHFGSTAVPGLPAKPVIDILVGVTSLHETKERIVPILEAGGYEYFWRPAFGDDTPPFYAWFIKRDDAGARLAHIHMVEPSSDFWVRLLFRDYLIAHPNVAKAYASLKHRLETEHSENRRAYTEAKGDFIREMTERAKQYIGGTQGHGPGG
jgi:GrpB-like predicted nucleotidyltransferase (UPF0157 family)